MFATCSKMKWAHLPLEGGVYAQDPELLRYWEIIWDLQGKKDAEDERKRKAESNKPRSRSR